MELQNAGNTGNTGNNQGATQSQEEEGDKWEERRTQVTSPDRRTEPRQDDEGRMMKHDIGEPLCARNSGRVEASDLRIEEDSYKRNDHLSSVHFSR